MLLSSQAAAAGAAAASLKAAISALHTKWLVDAGARVEEGAVIEISPFFAVEASQVAEKLEDGQSFNGSVYLT